MAIFILNDFCHSDRKDNENTNCENYCEADRYAPAILYTVSTPSIGYILD